MSLRDIVDFLLPAHFTEGEGGLKLLAFATLIDASIERAHVGLESRFPSRAGDSALELIGKDRLIFRGRAETATHYAARLKRWRWPRGHRTRGTAYALLEQICEYFGGALARVHTRRGRIYQRTVDGTESWVQGLPQVWDADPALPNWGRFWIYVQTGAGVTTNPDYFGAGDGTIGLLGFAEGDARAMRGLVSGRHPWKPAGVRAEWLVFVDDFATALPDATWQHWSRTASGHQFASRYDGWRYVSLNPAINNMYAGNPANFCFDTALVGDFVNTAGDPTSFPANAILPNGTTYAGNPASFPGSVLLLDDGDVI